MLLDVAPGPSARLEQLALIDDGARALGRHQPRHDRAQQRLVLQRDRRRRPRRRAARTHRRRHPSRIRRRRSAACGCGRARPTAASPRTGAGAARRALVAVCIMSSTMSVLLERVAGELGRAHQRLAQVLVIGRRQEEQAARQLGEELLVTGEAIEEVGAHRQHDAHRARSDRRRRRAARRGTCCAPRRRRRA